MQQGTVDRRQAGVNARFQFGVRGLLIVIALLMIPCAIVGNRVRFYQNQEAIHAQFRDNKSAEVGLAPVPADWLTAGLLNGQTREASPHSLIRPVGQGVGGAMPDTTLELQP